jgi:transketolase
LRKAFVDTLCALAADDPRVMLLTGDLGYMALEPFRDRFPDRFINAGVAEQNMVGMATGLAEGGYRPYVYSIAPFASLRPFEFIRNGAVLHRLPVRIVGMGMGFEYGHAGPTHYAVEDIAALRTLPALTVVVPADSAQARTAMRATADLPGPVYYSLGKDDRISIPDLDGRFALGRLQPVRQGDDAVIVTMGSIAIEAIEAAALLAARGVNVGVAILSSFNPDPSDDLAALVSRHSLVVSVEAQTISGGLGACVATVIATRGLRCRLSPLAVTTSPDGTSGSQADRWRFHGIDREAIAAAVMAGRVPAGPTGAGTAPGHS